MFGLSGEVSRGGWRIAKGPTLSYSFKLLTTQPIYLKYVSGSSCINKLVNYYRNMGHVFRFAGAVVRY